MRIDSDHILHFSYRVLAGNLAWLVSRLWDRRWSNELNKLVFEMWLLRSRRIWRVR